MLRPHLAPPGVVAPASVYLALSTANAEAQILAVTLTLLPDVKLKRKRSFEPADDVGTICNPIIGANPTGEIICFAVCPFMHIVTISFP